MQNNLTPIVYFKFEKYEIANYEMSGKTKQYIAKNFSQIGILNGQTENFDNFLDTPICRKSQIVDVILNYYSNQSRKYSEFICFEDIDYENSNGYIISTAVKYNPIDWSNMTVTGDYDHSKKSIFEYINPKYLLDLQNNKAILLIDQSVEGYSTEWLWEWLHKKCKEYNLNPRCIIYATGDQSCNDRYQEWCNNFLIGDQLKVIPSTSLSMYVRNHYQNFNLDTNFDRILNYKQSNLDKIYLFDCLNKRDSLHRILNYFHLINAGIVDKGNMSVTLAEQWNLDINTYHDSSYLKQYNLPSDFFERNEKSIVSRQAIHNLNSGDEYFNYVERIISDLYLHSWVSVVVESRYFDYEHSVFISEKTYKPIACMQPFIIVGARGSLRYLKKLGYKTFSPYIDESYDELPDEERFVAIINAIKQIESIEDKVGWLNGMRDILEHNFELFMQIGRVKSNEQIEITKYYFEYFKDKNV